MFSTDKNQSPCLFISHSNDESKLAAAIAAALLNHVVSLTVYDTPRQETSQININEALGRCNHFVLIIGAETGSFQKLEVENILRRKISEDRIRLVDFRNHSGKLKEFIPFEQLPTYKCTSDDHSPEEIGYLIAKWIAKEFEFAWIVVYASDGLQAKFGSTNDTRLNKTQKSAVKKLKKQALALYHSGNLDGALALWQTIEQISRSQGNNYSLEVSLYNQALVKWNQGELDRAMILSNEALAISHYLPLEYKINVIALQALILRDRGDLPAALNLFRQQEKICRQLNDYPGIVISLHNQAVILANRGHVSEAMQLALDAYETAKRMGSVDLVNQMKQIIESLKPLEKEIIPDQALLADSSKKDIRIGYDKGTISTEAVHSDNITDETASSDLHRYHFSAFYPEKAKRNEVSKLIACVHSEPKAKEVVIEALKRARPSSGVKLMAGSAPASAPRGSVIKATPDVNGLEFDTQEASLSLWEDAQYAEFRFKPRISGRVCNGWVHFWLEGMPLADVPVSIFITEEKVPDIYEEALAEANARPYRTIFPSYSHKDSMIVERLEAYAESFGDEYLRDVRALRSGQCWCDELMEFIKRAEIFQLFWSKNAAGSTYVRDEWQHALEVSLTRKNPHFVRPVYWTRQPASLPPELENIHFVKLQLRESWAASLKRRLVNLRR